MAKFLDQDGNEVEAFTQEERDAYAATIVEQKVGETKAEYESRIKDREEFHASQKENFGKLRELSEKQLAELNAKDRIIYDNQIALQKANEEREKSEKETLTAKIDAEIKAKSNGNADLEAKIRANLEFINIDARTPEQISAKVALARGGVFEQNPDMLAMVGGYNGTVYPGGVKPTEKKESFADTERGKEIMRQAGMIVELPK